ncbi:mandelate racemase/muconate lactonizing enzyme family protein [uncultured Draconibacterium sp.]|uniref:mandelate racemase/muconate lactonizing enzyme family protein n=1 Tax=uncultured Draconibacterium sp. TaxID=1573823 RepID=UPI0025DDC6DF|nr:mandelate racemase/muconate lactonizing enzyme family protein [uncultured Draconibacterium sp.]
MVSRRKFVTGSIAGGVSLSSIPWLSGALGSSTTLNADLHYKYAKLDAILHQPVLKKELFTTPVIIESVELLRFEGSFLCRVRSTDGAEGISVGHAELRTLYPIFLNRLRSFFIGQDARDLDLILERVFVYHFNFRFNGISLGIPLATIEFAILDMLGKIANKSVGQLIGEIHNPEVGVYISTEQRHLPLEEHFAHIKETVAEYNVNAVKIKIGYQYAGTKDIHYSGLPGKSEKLIPLAREYFGDNFTLYADSNGYYDVGGAIEIGKLLEEYNYGFFEEPVKYWHFEDIKKVADALELPIANGEQDQSYYNFRWLIANDGIEIVQPDQFYFGGFIRSMKVALMANAFGKTCVPHMSPGGLGYLYAIHFVSAIPNAGLHIETRGVETHVPFECETSPLSIVNSKIKVPIGPGLGIEIDPDFIKKHTEVKN